MKNIVFFGDSLTAGYGLAKANLESIPALIQNKINNEGLVYHFVNAGVSGDTSAGGLDRVAKVLDQQIDVFVLELGANDILRNISPEATFRNLQSIISIVRDKFPKVKLVLLGMELPMWLPGQRAADFRFIFRKLAEINEMTFIPFLLEGVAGVKHLNLPDGLHPLASGYQIIAAKIWPFIKAIL
ncbi:MAG: arylesterase [Pedobacter sp.]|nr:MAG: arylesterase [Pedobacter sp.]